MFDFPAEGGSIATEEWVGDKALLTTDDKTTIVNAVNEIEGEVSNLASDNVTLSIYKTSNFATP